MFPPSYFNNVRRQNTGLEPVSPRILHTTSTRYIATTASIHGLTPFFVHIIFILTPQLKIVNQKYIRKEWQKYIDIYVNF